MSSEDARLLELFDAILEVRVSTPDATAREVHAQLVSNQCWAGLTFPEVKKACSKLGKKAHATARDLPAASDDQMDPRRWQPWPGLGTPPMNLVDGEHPLTFCFKEAVPMGIKVSLGFGRPLDDVAADALWKSVLCNVVSSFAGYPKVYRIMIEGPDQRMGLLIDVLSGPHCCPPLIPTHFTKWDAKEGQTAGKAACEPAVLVRYMMTHRDDPISFDALLQTSPMDVSLDGKRAKKACNVMLSTLRSRGVHDSAEAELRGVKGIRADVVQAGFDALMQTTHALSSEYKKFFDKQSPYHDHNPSARGRFKPGLLVPPQEQLRAPISSQRACAACAKSLEERKTASECAACNSIFYCSKQCAVEHWPIHKKVCRKTVSQRRSQPDTEGRESLVMPMLNYDQWMFSVTGQSTEGMETFSWSTTGNTEMMGRASHPDESIPNVHGDKDFMVKVQIPMCGTLGTAMVYDEHRTFTVALPCRPPQGVPGAPKLHEVIRQTGPMGAKGYFVARREGRNLRIFFDILPPPSW